MRFTLVVLLMMAAPLGATRAQISFQIGMPSLVIGFRQPHYPTLVAVPGYPVYYDPNANGNYFFYDGMYWVFEGDNWYASDWYNGPWGLVNPHVVPVFLLRVPVAYYRHPPAYFRGWYANSPPRWGEHWGGNWERQRGGWDRWDRRQVPAAAPLPAYQRRYSGDRYPHAEQQRALRYQNYRHEPRDEAVRHAYREPPRHEQPAQPGRQQQRAQPAQPNREQPHAQQGPPGREPPKHEKGDQGRGDQGRGHERGGDHEGGGDRR